MGTYRKKPVEIQAFQWTRHAAEVMDICEYPDWVIEALWYSQSGKEPVEGQIVEVPEGWVICTLEGALNLPYDNYIIRGVEGEIYSCDPGIFHKTYEKVSE